MRFHFLLYFFLIQFLNFMHAWTVYVTYVFLWFCSSCPVWAMGDGGASLVQSHEVIDYEQKKEILGVA